MDGNNYSSAIDLLKEVDAFSNSQIKKRDDIHKLFELVLENDKHNLLEEVSFTAKYVNGLMRVLKSGVENPEIESMQHIKKDLSQNISKVQDLLKNIISYADEPTRQYYHSEYFQMTQTSFMNLNELLSDLEWTKKYLNDQKRQNPN